MRCSAVITEQARRQRATEADTRCQRLAKTRGYCLQHAEERSWDHQCQMRDCRSRDVRRHPETGWWLCEDHAIMYFTHQQIVEKIMALPPRD